MMLVEQSESVGLYLFALVPRTNYWCIKHPFCVLLFLQVPRENRLLVKMAYSHVGVFIHITNCGGGTYYLPGTVLDKDPHPHRAYFYTDGSP